MKNKQSKVYKKIIFAVFSSFHYISFSFHKTFLSCTYMQTGIETFILLKRYRADKGVKVGLERGLDRASVGLEIEKKKHGITPNQIFFYFNLYLFFTD